MSLEQRPSRPASRPVAREASRAVLKAPTEKALGGFGLPGLTQTEGFLSWELQTGAGWLEEDSPARLDLPLASSARANAKLDLQACTSSFG